MGDSRPNDWGEDKQKSLRMFPLVQIKFSLTDSGPRCFLDVTRGETETFFFFHSLEPAARVKLPAAGCCGYDPAVINQSIRPDVWGYF